MADSVARALEATLANRVCFGELVIKKSGAHFIVSHRDDESRDDLDTYRCPEQAVEIAKHDEARNYRPLKTAPNLRHGWRLELETLERLKRALDHFYPGRLAMFAAWKENRLQATPLRQLLDRQSGMYRVAAKVSDEQINDVVSGFCRSNGGCLRTILWKRDERGTIASTKLPKEKFDPTHDQTGRDEQAIPLLCQEACNLLVAGCRKVVKGE